MRGVNMVYNSYKMGSFNLHTIKTDRFKTIRMEIMFRNNIDPDSIVKRTMLFELLLESSKEYKTKRDLILKCEELYNANIYAETMKVGNEVVSSINYEILDPKYTDDLDLDDALKLPFDIIFNPDISDTEFNEEKLETIRIRSLAELDALKEEPKKYAIAEALKAMDRKSVSSINILGDKESVNRVNKSNIFEEYMKILEHDYIDIYVIGDIDSSKVIDIINKYQHFNTIKHHEVSLYVDNSIRNRINKVSVSEELNQSQLIYIMNLIGLTEFETSYVSHIFNHILGGGSLDSKLYKSLRNDNSLCYSVSSKYSKYDRLMMISTSIDKDNIKLAKRLIEDAIKSMSKNISDEEIDKARQAIVNAIKVSLDSQHQIISNYFFNEIADLDLVDKRIEEYSKVTKEDVINMAKKLKINTIYILEGEQNENN